MHFQEEINGAVGTIKCFEFNIFNAHELDLQHTYEIFAMFTIWKINNRLAYAFYINQIPRLLAMI